MCSLPSADALQQLYLEFPDPVRKARLNAEPFIKGEAVLEYVEYDSVMLEDFFAGSWPDAAGHLTTKSLRRRRCRLTTGVGIPSRNPGCRCSQSFMELNRHPPAILV